MQEATVPDALAGHDVCGQAPTGSGKTLAYALPLVAQTGHDRGSGSPTGLVLVPTRELAQQVHQVLSSLYAKKRNRVVCVHGGTGYGAQLRALNNGVDVVVACPGRLEDLVERGAVRLHDVRLVVLDEADRMVDMGFSKPVCRLVDKTAQDRQVLLFSATMTREVEAISRRFQHQPRRAEVQPEVSTANSVTHLFWRTDRADRVKVTAQLVDRHGKAFVFCRTKHGADRVARQLRVAGVDAAAIHGDRSQAQRERALASFAAGRTKALVATDVVARGIHVDDIPCVIHFDLPPDPHSYIHRSGRTGRVGQMGTVVSLVPDENRAEVKALQRALEMEAQLGIPFADGAVAPPLPGADRRPSNPPRGSRRPPPHGSRQARGASRRYKTNRGSTR
ncbi:MAG: DEAD/DEAH box helicase [Acidimicrobiales bacterium]